MSFGVVSFLCQAVVISLSGVLAPGPMTAATLAAGAKRRHAGAWMAVGHGLVELPLMGLILVGAGALLQNKAFGIGVGMIGGIALLLMGATMLMSLGRAGGETQKPRTSAPLWTGIVLTGANPYFLLWWTTVGLALATRAVELGVAALALFAVVHWLCDLVWLEVLSVASHKGAALMGKTIQQVIVLVCSAAMGIFGAWFVVDAFHGIAAAQAAPAIVATTAPATVPATAPAVPRNDIPGLANFAKVSDGLYRGEQPTAEGIKRLTAMGIKTVVNLRSFHSDRDLLQGTGLRYAHIYCKTWHPEDEDVVKFLKIMRDPANRPVFVHCQQGADRTGTMVAVYRMVEQGWSIDDAVKEMNAFGSHPIWKEISEYLAHFDAAAMRKKVEQAPKVPVEGPQ